MSMKTIFAIAAYVMIVWFITRFIGACTMDESSATEPHDGEPL